MPLSWWTILLLIVYPGNVCSLCVEDTIQIYRDFIHEAEKVPIEHSPMTRNNIFGCSIQNYKLLYTRRSVLVMLEIAQNNEADSLCSYAVRSCNISPTWPYKSITAAKTIIPPKYPSRSTFLEALIPALVPETQSNNMMQHLYQILTGTATIRCDVIVKSSATNSDFHFLISTVSNDKNPLFIFKSSNSNPGKYVLSAEVKATENGHVSEPTGGSASDNTENIFIP